MKNERGAKALGSSGMRIRVIDKIEAKLRKYPELSYEIESDRVSVKPSNPSGFTVWIEVYKNKYTVGFDGWHEVFDEEEKALDCFAFGFSDQCRLKVVKRGKMECSWAVESWDEQEWVEDSVTGLLVVPFWRRKTVEYRQNDLIKGSGNEDG